MMTHEPHPAGAGYQSRPRVLLLELRERVSQKGNKYLCGFLGKAGVVGFAEEVDDRGQTVWRLYVEPPRPVEGRK